MDNLKVSLPVSENLTDESVKQVEALNGKLHSSAAKVSSATESYKSAKTAGLLELSFQSIATTKGRMLKALQERATLIGEAREVVKGLEFKTPGQLDIGVEQVQLKRALNAVQQVLSNPNLPNPAARLGGLNIQVINQCIDSDGQVNRDKLADALAELTKQAGRVTEHRAMHEAARTGRQALNESMADLKRELPQLEAAARELV